MYRPVELSVRKKSLSTVAIVDSGADETVISERAARLLKVYLYGIFRATSACNSVIVGRHADIRIKEQWSGSWARLTVGVTDVPFRSEDMDEEGVEVILGVDFLQATAAKLAF
jgi:hypothetical protein